MKYYLLNLILLSANVTFSLPKNLEPDFPELNLVNCHQTYRTDEDIFQCETTNFQQAEAAITQFFPKLYTFVPKNYQATMDQSQRYWKDLIDVECRLIVAVFDPDERPTKMLNCLTERYEQRLSDLIYAYILWNNKYHNAQD